jgi:hypothetical protein
MDGQHFVSYFFCLVYTVYDQSTFFHLSTFDEESRLLAVKAIVHSASVSQELCCSKL